MASGSLTYVLLERLLDRSSHIITVLNPDGSLRWSTGGALSIFDAHVGLEPGENVFSVVHPDEVSDARSSFDDLLSGKIGREQPLQFRIRTTEGSWRYIEAFADSLLDDPDIRGLVIYAHDVTERHLWMAEREGLLEELRAQAAQRAELIAAIVHEIRSPLTTISGFCSLLAEGLTTEPNDDIGALKDHIEVIEAAVQRLVRLTGDLRLIAPEGPDGLRFTPGTVDLPRIAQRAIDSRRGPAQAEGVDLVATIQPGPTFVGDGDRLGQVIDNLLSNAVKFTPAGGRIELRVNYERPWWRIDCEDNGIGIPEEELPKIFDQFYRATNARADSVSGSGIGLWVVRTIVEAHGGEVELVSNLGAGTAVTIRIGELQASDFRE